MTLDYIPLDPTQSARENMVLKQIERRGIYHERVLDAMRNVPRHRFVPQELQSQAYDDCPLAIGHGQTISQPYIVALMSTLLQLEGSEAVLEIGCGSGYQAAILSQLAGVVHTIEYIPALAESAAHLLSALGYANIHVHTGDGTLGLEECAPYRGIIVTAAAPHVPLPLIEQLADSGRLIIPVGERRGQQLQVWTRHGADIEQENTIPVAFVPLRGAHGWSETDWN